MLSFLKTAFTMVNSMKREGESTISVLGRLVGKMFLTNVLPIILPFLIVGVISFTLIGVMSYKFNVMQFVDSISKKSSTSGGVGNYNYTQEEFEDAVAVTAAASLTDGYGDFASKLSGSTDPNFKDIDSFNSYIKNTVNAAGHGTAAGVVAAAMSLSYGYSKATGFKLYYQYPNNTRTGHEGVTDATYLDCRAFVQWAVYNGGFNADILDYGTHLNEWGEGYKISDPSAIKPADTFGTYGTGHYGLIIGVYGDTCYTAEEAGYGSGLVVLNRSCSELLGRYNVYDMSHYYNDKSNVRPG